MKLRIFIFCTVCTLTLFNFNLCESHSSTEVGPVPNWQWVESNDTSSVYVDMNKKNFHRIDKNTFSYWIAITNINDQTITFSHITADILNKNYREDRGISFKDGAVSIDTATLDTWSPAWNTYSITYEESTINYILSHLAELEVKK